MFAKLLVIAGPDRGKVYPVELGLAMVVGRSRDVDARLTDPRVAAFHCRLEVQASQVIVTDLDSLSGTAVNGSFILQYPAVMNDTIAIGDTVLKVLDPDDNEAKELGGAPPAKPAAAAASPASVPAAAAKPAPKPAAKPAPVAANFPERAELLSGKSFGNFAVGQQLARGRHSIVFEAQDLKNNRPVALKVHHAAFGQNEANVKQFGSAAKLAMPLKNANVVRTLSAGKTGPYYWLALEKINGESMTQFIRHRGVAGMLDWRRALRMSVHLARGLVYLHEQGLIYRNLGPQNIMVDGDESIPRYGDFSRLRQLYAEAAGATRDTEELTDDLLMYVSPEQTRDGTDIDQRSDIFSLGSLTYALLTGHPPFEGGSLAETITRIRRERPELLKKYQLAIPEALQGVVLQMLGKRPEDRYQTAAETLQDLERVLKYQNMTL